MLCCMGGKNNAANSQKYRLSLDEFVAKQGRDDLEAFVHASFCSGIDDEHETVDIGVIVVPDAANL